MIDAPAPWWQPLTGAVLLGGASERFQLGETPELASKALAPFGQSTVGGRVVSALRDGGVDPVVAIGGEVGHRLGLPTVPDLHPGEGPLAGLVTALQWARTGAVLVSACDLPLLTGPDVTRMVESARALEEPTVLVATAHGRPNATLSLWPADRVRRLGILLKTGTRAMHAALDDEDWRGVDFGPTPQRPLSPLRDVDTPEALAALIAADSDWQNTTSP